MSEQNDTTKPGLMSPAEIEAIPELQKYNSSRGHRISEPGVEERTAEVADDPSVKRWIARLSRCIKDMPKNVKIHIYEDTINIQALSEDGSDFVCKDGYEDQRATIASITARLSAGEW